MAEQPAAVLIDGVSVTYAASDTAAVGPVDLVIRPGERWLLLGASGSGKSSLLNALTGLIPHSIASERTGEVRLLGEDVAARTPAGWSSSVARLFQKAEQTLCGMTVADEVAFALENQGLPADEIAMRAEAAMRSIGLPQDWLDRRSSHLSGGEKQLVAIAAIMAQQAPIIVADEPTAHLAPEAARRLERLLLDVPPHGAALIVDHRLDDLITLIDRVAILGGDGRIVASGPPRAVFRDHGRTLDRLGIWRPIGSRLDDRLMAIGHEVEPPPLTFAEALHAMDRLPPPLIDRARAALVDFIAPRIAQAGAIGATVARLDGASCAPLFAKPVLHDVTVSIAAGEVVAILGANGAGKSTLAASLAGLLRLKAGRREGAMGGISFQNPDSQFIAGSVGEELAAALDAAGVRAEVADVEALAERWRLVALLDRHPMQLSEGQKRRLSLALLMAGDRFPLIVLDEPTGGLDAAGSDALIAEIDRLRDRARAVAIVTHDMDFALATAARWIIVGDGRILSDGPASELMRDRALMKRAGLAPPHLLAALDWLEKEPVPAC
ncbi:ATP-binding cassette domain-containing protein [Rhizobium sp. EC-SD404]|uniref:ABC transporter ATP-binding protein n=1 Tax=Rhizobium sp. EC-SD404 TaxID=2038389 RepID=UPI0012533143|nr:ATP-binding cassette domain-containing protein [Rhizobium sp. EC-SD404]VVT10539.1 Energy-coupling factor transport system ATP-binding protein [Rhizobium sp. EC-SD404]